MLKNRLSFFLAICMMISAFGGISIYAEEAQSVFETEKVIRQNTANGAYSDVSDVEKTSRYRNKFYYIFDGMESIEDISDPVFKLYSQNGDEATDLTYYVSDTKTPVGTNAEEWDAYFEGLTAEVITDFTYENTTLSYDVSSINAKNGQTVIFMIANATSRTGVNIAGGANTDCPPQISGLFDEAAFEDKVLGIVNAASDEASIISAIKTYSKTIEIDLALFETVPEATVAEYMLEKAGSYTSLSEVKEAYDLIAIDLRGVKKEINACSIFEDDGTAITKISTDILCEDQNKYYFVFDNGAYTGSMMKPFFKTWTNSEAFDGAVELYLSENEFNSNKDWFESAELIACSTRVDENILKADFTLSDAKDGEFIVVAVSGFSGTLGAVGNSLCAPSVEFKYDEESYNLKVLELLNFSETENLKNVLEVYAQALNIDLSKLENVYEYGVIDILADVVYTSLDEVACIFDSTVEKIKNQYTDKEIYPDKVVKIVSSQAEETDERQISLDNGGKVLYVFDSVMYSENMADSNFSVYTDMPDTDNITVNMYTGSTAPEAETEEEWIEYFGTCEKNGITDKSVIGNVLKNKFSINADAGSAVVFEVSCDSSIVLGGKENGTKKATLFFRYDQAVFESMVLERINNASYEDVLSVLAIYAELLNIDTAIPTQADVDIIKTQMSDTVFDKLGDIKSVYEAAVQKSLLKKKLIYPQRVISYNIDSKVYKDVSASSTSARYRIQNYYIFDNVDFASGINEATFKVYSSNSASKTLAVYVSSEKSPEGVEAEDWSAFISNAQKKPSCTATYDSNVMTCKLSDLGMKDGDTLVLMYTYTSNSNIGSLANTVCKPQLGIVHDIRSIDLEITDQNGSEVTDFNNVPTYAKYALSLISVGKIDETFLKNAISLKSEIGEDIPIALEWEENLNESGNVYVYDYIINAPVLDYEACYSFCFNKAMLDEFGNACMASDIEFKTEQKPYSINIICNSNAVDYTVSTNKEIKLLFAAKRYSPDGVLLETKAVGEEVSGSVQKSLTFDTMNTGDYISAFAFEYTGESIYEAELQPKAFAEVSNADSERKNKKFEINTKAGNINAMLGIILKDEITEIDGRCLISASDLQNKAVFFETVKSDNSGKLSFVWTVPEGMKSEDYVLFVKRNNGFDDAYVSFYYQNPDEQDAMIASLSSDSISYTDFGSKLIQNGKLLDINLDEFNELSSGKDLVVSELYSKRTAMTDAEKLGEALDFAVLTQKINNITDINSLKQAISENADLYGVNDSAIYKTVYNNKLDKYSVSKDTVFKTFVTYDIKTSDELLDMFELAIMKSALLNLGNYRNSYDILNSVKEALGIDFTEYNKRGTNKDAVLETFAENVDEATKLSDIKEIFNESVRGTSIPQKIHSGGGGGSSSGKGASTGVMGNPVSADENNKLEVLADKKDQKQFIDLSEEHWAYSYVGRLSRNGYINGYEDNSFKPESNITRAEFVSIIIRSFALEDVAASCSFMDVSSESWYYPTIASAFSKGIVNGIDHDFFVPDNNVSREDAAVIITNLFKYLGKTVTETEVEFADKAEISSYAYNALGYLNKVGIFNGYENGEIRPRANLTRAEACKIISQAIDARWIN